MSPVSNYVLVKIFALLGTLVIVSRATEIHRSIGQADIPKSQVSALIGHPVTISALALDDSPLKSCRWERRSLLKRDRYIVEISQSGNNTPTTHLNNPSGFKCNCSYEYSGIGLEKGDCSITIRDVNEFHMSKWECLLTDKNGNTWIGGLHVEDYDVVHKPYFEEEALLHKFIYDKTSVYPANITCCANEPDNSLHLNIFLKNETNASPTFDESKNDTYYKKQSRACRHTTFFFKPKHNRQLLVCNATSYDGSHKHDLTTSIRVSVEFGPLLPKGNWLEQGLTEDNSLQVNVTFLGNPCGNASWNLYTDKGNNISFEISPNHTKYSTCIYHLYGDKYVASIKILNVEKGDYGRKFKLRLLNEHGSHEVDIQPHSEEELIDANDAFWIMMLLIGLGAVILFIFIGTVLWVVVRKRDRSRGSYSPARRTDDADGPTNDPDRETTL